VPGGRQRGIAALGMKRFSGKGEPLQKGLLTPDEALRYAMSLPVVTTITGMDKIDVLHQNLQIAQNFQPLTPEEMEALRQRCRPAAADGRFEHYKVSMQFDNPEARMAHGFPLDAQQMEVKEMLKESENTGSPFPEMKS
jgi:hypothetical protein